MLKTTSEGFEFWCSYKKTTCIYVMCTMHGRV